ncbi:MAG: ABC transporter permease [Acetivibrio ethanolgignens]
MKTVFHLVNRNRKLYFKDKGMFFTSLITPLILIVLYGTFLEKVYKDSFSSALPAGFMIEDVLLNGCVRSQLCSALLAVSCITVAFCVNLTMVQDKVTGARKDFLISPVQPYKLALGYYIATVINTMLVNLVAFGICLLYIGSCGWQLTVGDITYLLLDIFFLVLFGTGLSSVICFPLSTQGQLSAVGTIVSAGYGFICGAYMPISNFGEGLQKVLSYFPGTYGTSMLKNHAMRGVFEEMHNVGFPNEVVEGIKAFLDCTPQFRGEVVSVNQMMAVMLATVTILMGIYVLMNRFYKIK